MVLGATINTTRATSSRPHAPNVSADEPREGELKKQTVGHLLRNLSRAGFDKAFVRSAILPDWWQASCETDESLLSEIEVRIARFLGAPVSAMSDAALAVPNYPGAQLRHVRGADRERLSPAIHAALRIASAVVRNQNATEISIPPADALAWRRKLTGPTGAISLEAMVADLWKRGIPVVPCENLPTPGFQGLACISEGRPVVLLGQQYDEPGRVAFLIAHEVGHVASGECSAESPVVDQLDEVADDTDSEQRADAYATRMLVGNDAIPPVDTSDWRDLANRAVELERTRGIDAGAVIFAWARRTGDYGTATTAIRGLYRSRGARRLLRDHFDRNVNIDAAGETDAALLRCVFGHGDADASAA